MLLKIYCLSSSLEFIIDKIFLVNCLSFLLLSSFFLDFLSLVYIITVSWNTILCGVAYYFLPSSSISSSYVLRHCLHLNSLFPAADSDPNVKSHFSLLCVFSSCFNSFIDCFYIGSLQLVFFFLSFCLTSSYLT